MMTTLVLTGSPENALLQGAGAEMAAFHGLPSASWALSDSPVMDSQASAEKLMTLFVHSLTGVNMIWGAGNTETSKTISPEVAVLDNELIGSCKRFNSRFTVDEEHLAMDLIREVSFGGSFLESAHTLEHFMEEIRYSDLPNRVTRSRWENNGSLSVDEKAGRIVDNILSGDPDIYLSGAQMEKLESIEKRWRERLSG
jgi:trimethylamine--corrinoid protein Co-methyltransferase